MTLRERLETAGITYEEKINVKCGGKTLYDKTIVALLESNSPLLEMKSGELIFQNGKGFEIEVIE